MVSGEHIGRSASLPAVPLAGDEPQTYIFLCLLSAVHVGQEVVGIACTYRNLSRIGVRDMLSYQSLMPAVAGTPRYEMRPGRWRSLSVMGATPPLWIPAFAGMTKRGPVAFRHT